MISLTSATCMQVAEMAALLYPRERRGRETMATALQELLERRFGVDEEDFRVGLADFAERTGSLVITEVRPSDYFGPAERATLTELGLDLTPVDGRQLGAVGGLATAYAQLVATSLRVGQVAEILAVDPTRVRQRIQARSLYGFKHHGNWMIPSFQVTGGHLLPGLRLVVAALAPSLHPVAVARWFTTTTDALDLEGEVVSPAAWLASGAPPAPLVVLAEALDEL